MTTIGTVVTVLMIETGTVIATAEERGTDLGPARAHARAHARDEETADVTETATADVIADVIATAIEIEIEIGTAEIEIASLRCPTSSTSRDLRCSVAKTAFARR